MANLFSPFDISTMYGGLGAGTGGWPYGAGQAAPSLATPSPADNTALGMDQASPAPAQAGLGGGAWPTSALISAGLGMLGGGWAGGMQGYSRGAALDQAARAQAAKEFYQRQQLGIERARLERDPENIRALNALVRQGVAPDVAQQMIFPRTEEWVPTVTEQGAFLTNRRTGEVKDLGQSYRKISGREETAIQGADDAVVANQNLINTLQRAKELSPKAAYGVFSKVTPYTTGLPAPFSTGAQETNDLSALLGEANIEKFRTAFGPKPSRGQLKILDDLRSSIDKPDAARQSIYNEAIAMAQEQLRVNADRAARLRAGTYYRPGGGEGMSERERARQELIRRRVIQE